MRSADGRVLTGRSPRRSRCRTRALADSVSDASAPGTARPHVAGAARRWEAARAAGAGSCGARCVGADVVGLVARLRCSPRRCSAATSQRGDRSGRWLEVGALPRASLPALDRARPALRPLRPRRGARRPLVGRRLFGVFNMVTVGTWASSRSRTRSRGSRDPAVPKLLLFWVLGDRARRARARRRARALPAHRRLRPEHADRRRRPRRPAVAAEAAPASRVRRQRRRLRRRAPARAATTGLGDLTVLGSTERPARDRRGARRRARDRRVLAAPARRRRSS